MQLLVCYAFILIIDDLVKIVWGAEYLAMGIPAEFRLPPYRVAGGFVPPFYLFMVAMAVIIGLGSLYIVTKTRFGKIVRAAAHNASMVSALGIRVRSEEHTSELQSIMRNSYAFFCLKKKTQTRRS